jgi:hypothetical protein
MRYLLLLLLAITSLSGTDWTPPGVIPIDSKTTVMATSAVRTSSVYMQFNYFNIPATVASVQASATPIKSTRQVWAHGIVHYFHGFPVANKTGTLNPGVNAAVDLLYQGDPDYATNFYAKNPATQPIFWIAEYTNVYKARWEASYNPAYTFSSGTYPAIIFTLKIEDFVGIDPMPYPAEHRDLSLVPLPPAPTVPPAAG